jgi:hypothetical protein
VHHVAFEHVRRRRPAPTSGSVAGRARPLLAASVAIVARCMLGCLVVASAGCRHGDPTAARHHIRRLLAPREIVAERRNVSDDLVAATRDEPVERGSPRPVIDGIGWFCGIPAKILLWNRRAENHHVSADTEDALRCYLAANGLDHVKVRINQYAPLEDWRRLPKNTTVGWPYRYTLGALSLVGETLLPGRVFGGDHYNPYTATIHLYSDLPSVALHEGAHAKDFARRRRPGTYALVYALPLGNLWPEAIATGDAIAYAQHHGDVALEKETYRILYPAYGSYLGGTPADFIAAPIALPIWLGTVVAGHAAGRIKAGNVPEIDAAPAWEPARESDVAANDSVRADRVAALPSVDAASDSGAPPDLIGDGGVRPASGAARR